MHRKNEEDLEIENRVRGHVRREMVERGLSVNRANQRLGLGAGTLSKILAEKRGFGSGFVLKVMRAFNIPAKLLLEEDPPPRFMRAGVPEIPDPK